MSALTDLSNHLIKIAKSDSLHPELRNKLHAEAKQLTQKHQNIQTIQSEAEAASKEKMPPEDLNTLLIQHTMKTLPLIDDHLKRNSEKLSGANKIAEQLTEFASDLTNSPSSRNQPNNK